MSGAQLSPKKIVESWALELNCPRPNCERSGTNSPKTILMDLIILMDLAILRDLAILMDLASDFVILLILMNLAILAILSLI